MTSLFFALFLSISAQALECGTFKTKHIMDGKTVHANEKVCLREIKNQIGAFSEKCHMMDKASCPFSALKKGAEMDSFIRPKGSPGFLLCHSIEGSPQIYEIQVKGQWHSSSRCFWKNSNEFVDIDTLILYYTSL